jgi:hypothetical protein
VTEVEVDKVLGLCMIVSILTSKRAHCQSEVSLTVCDKAAKVPADNAMPCCALPFVELYIVSIRLEIVATLRLTVRLMWWAISCDDVSQAILALLYGFTVVIQTFSTVYFSIASWAACVSVLVYMANSDE